MSEENKAIVRRIFEEVWNQNDLAVADEVVASDQVNHDPGLPGMPSGPEGLKYLVQTFRAAFPDLQFTVEDQVAEGDKVVTRWTMRGSNTGSFLGMPPTGRTVAVSGINIDRLANGKLVEHWRSADQLGMLQQLGLIPTPG